MYWKLNQKIYQSPVTGDIAVHSTKLGEIGKAHNGLWYTLAAIF
jgi:hypothetical protein